MIMKAEMRITRELVFIVKEHGCGNYEKYCACQKYYSIQISKRTSKTSNKRGNKLRFIN